MPTAQTIITNALTKLGQCSPGETPNTSESTSALAMLNMLIGNWNIRDDMATAAVNATLSLSSGSQSAALATRVARVVSASVVMAAGPTFGLKIVDAVEWNTIPDRDSQSNKIKYLFYDRGATTGTVYLSPVPLSGLTLNYLAWAAQSTFATLATNNTLLPGYEEALTAELAIQLSSSYPATPPSEALVDERDRAIGEIRRLNASLWASMPREDAA